MYGKKENLEHVERWLYRKEKVSRRSNDVKMVIFFNVHCFKKLSKSSASKRTYTISEKKLFHIILLRL